jgi:hypothetical protein
MQIVDYCLDHPPQLKICFSLLIELDCSFTFGPTSFLSLSFGCLMDGRDCVRARITWRGLSDSFKTSLDLAKVSGGFVGAESTRGRFVVRVRALSGATRTGAVEGAADASGALAKLFWRSRRA